MRSRSSWSRENWPAWRVIAAATPSGPAAALPAGGRPSGGPPAARIVASLSIRSWPGKYRYAVARDTPAWSATAATEGRLPALTSSTAVSMSAWRVRSFCAARPLSQFAVATAL